MLSAFIAFSLLMSASTAFARMRNETPRTHSKKKHSKTGRNRGNNTHKSSDNIPDSN